MTAELGEHTRIAVYGAGSLGCFVGGLLHLGGRRVTFLARSRIAAGLAVHGLLLTDFAGLRERVGAELLDVQTAPSFLREADLVLLTVKSRDTAAAAEEIARLTAPGLPVVSLQNGTGNTGFLRARLGPDRVLGGMVAFNAVHKGRGHFHRGSLGAIVIEAGRPDILRLLSVPGLEVEASSNITGVQWGKLLFNLNNALNALSNLPLRQELESRAWRRLLAAQIAEALVILEAAGIEAAPAHKVPPRLLPRILRLPSALFGLVARPMLRIDPEARSSTWEDLVQRRPTEVDQFQGAIVRLAREHGLKAPLSEAILHRVKEAEDAGAGPPGLTPEQIACALPREDQDTGDTSCWCTPRQRRA
jgi:2-dehydropantoate 2-reductase